VEVQFWGVELRVYERTFLEWIRQRVCDILSGCVSSWLDGLSLFFYLFLLFYFFPFFFFSLFTFLITQEVREGLLRCRSMSLGDRIHRRG